MSAVEETRDVPRKVTVATVCDGCDKRVEEASPDGWHHFSSSHSAWGNDSVDSFEWFDACSFACYVDIVRRAASGDVPRSTEIDEKDLTFVRDMLKAVAPDAA